MHQLQELAAARELQRRDEIDMGPITVKALVVPRRAAKVYKDLLRKCQALDQRYHPEVGADT